MKEESNPGYQINAMKAKYEKMRAVAERELSCSAHNMEHVMRVYTLCLQLAEGEPDIDLDVLIPAALLHDIARVKEDCDETGTTDHALLGAEMAEEILYNFQYPKEKIEQVKHCIITHRFRSTLEPQTREAKILFDADKLDVLGAVGVARCFMIAGQYNERIYTKISVDEYAKDNLVDSISHGRVKDISKHTPNLEFEIKLKHIPERLYTEKAKRIAQERLSFMAQFFEQLEKEIHGKV